MGLRSLPLLLLVGLVLAACSSGGGGVFTECGDGTEESPEECDDGNEVSCDGCSAGCVLETGWVCGDGELNESCGEQCDDGNMDPGDGCDQDCQSEACGNGMLDAGETCDDGNEVSCDGCSAGCALETGWVCGDGELNESCGEQCDDGDTVPGDGCDQNCQSEACGNGMLDAGETCDDGNEVSCDGCSAGCALETGWVCGDGELNESCGEQCDDGDTVPGDGCDADCQIETTFVISGEYSVTLDTVLDTCDFGSGSASSPMLVEETTAATAQVDIPIGGAGGTCNPQVYEHVADTLTRAESREEQLNACTVQVEVLTVLTFERGGSVSGPETTTLSALAGDCSDLILPCTVKLALAGSRCDGCFQCSEPTGRPTRTVTGPLGAAFGPFGRRSVLGHSGGGR